MKKLLNLLLGYCQWRASGPNAGAFLNQCARHGLTFWSVKWEEGGGFTFRTPVFYRKKVDELAGKADCEVRYLFRKGMGSAVSDLLRRWGFLLGLSLCLLAAGILSRFLLVVEVEGNSTVSTAAILWELDRLGVHPGAYGPALSEKDIANRVLTVMPELSYMTINLSGTRAEVIVRERVKPPELLDEDRPANIIAAADGIITSLRADGGRAMFQEGQIVVRGEVIISGRMDIQGPEPETADLGYLLVRAVGEVEARTWRTLEESVPLTALKKEYTGAETTLYGLKILWGRINFFKNSSISYAEYDKITSVRPLVIAGRELPLALVTTTCREYTAVEGETDRDEAAARLEAVLRRRLSQLMDANHGTVLRTDVVTRVEGDLLTVSLLAECREKIGRTVELPGETGRYYNTRQEETND